MPRISVMIPTVRKEAIEKRIIDFNKTSKGIDYELVVASTFPVTGPRVVHVAEPERRGVIAAANLAYQAASGDFLAYWSDDAVPADGCLAQMLAFIEKRKGPFIGSFSMRHHGKDIAQFGVYDKLYACWGCLSRETADLVGGVFDSRFKSFWADPDLALRVWSNGGRVDVCRTAFADLNHIEDEIKASNLKQHFVDDLNMFLSHWHPVFGGKVSYADVLANWQSINHPIPRETLRMKLCIRTRIRRLYSWLISTPRKSGSQ